MVLWHLLRNSLPTSRVGGAASLNQAHLTLIFINALYEHCQKMAYAQKIVRSSPQTGLFLSDLGPNLTYFRGRAHLSRTLGLGA